jgi:hypothetical protein
LEILFRRIYDKWDNKQSLVFLAINNTLFNDKFRTERKKEFPSMSMVNRVLREDKVWRAVLTELNLNPGTVLPTFSENLLYGVMSDRVHNPDISASAFLIQFKKRGRNTTRYFGLIE